MTNQRKGPVSAQRPKAVKILDVARRAGVSTATVSRALAAPEQVAAATRARVMTAIEETGYTPNASARNLRSRSTRMVLALVPGLSNTFFTPILNAIEDSLSAAGYGMIIGDTRHDTGREAHYTRLVRAGQADGLILFTGRLPRDGNSLATSSPIPIVLVCNEIPGASGLSLFDVADRKSAATATRYLIEAGHRRIAHIAGPAVNIEAQNRIAGYADALAAAGIPFDRSLVWGHSFRFDGGGEAARIFLAAADRPTAVFAAADEAAVSFIRAIREAGLRVPDDVSVVGFDDIDYASLIDPPLTTMHQPRIELGRAAAADLLTRMARGAPALPPTHVRLDCHLVVRASVRPAEPASEPRRARRAAGLR